MTLRNQIRHRQYILRLSTGTNDSKKVGGPQNTMDYESAGENFEEESENFDEDSDDYASEFSEVLTPNSAHSSSGSDLPIETHAKEIGFETKLKAASVKGVDYLYAEYLKSRLLYEKIPFYFVFVADLLSTNKRPDLADLVLANVVEIRPGEARWLRIYAYKLVSWGKASEAVAIYKAVSELREEDSQSSGTWWGERGYRSYSGIFVGIEELLKLKVVALLT